MAAETSQLSRSRVAVLAISGLAAAYGVYHLVHTISNSPASSALRRSNAVHRQRRTSLQTSTRPSSESFMWDPPDEDAPLGYLAVHDPASGNLSLTTLALSPLPAASDLESVLGSRIHEPGFEHELLINGVKCILIASLASRQGPAYQNILNDYSLQGIREAFFAHDFETILTYTPAISKVLSATLTEDDIREGLDRIMELGQVDDDAETHLETEAPADSNGDAAASDEPDQGLKGLLYHMAESDAKRKAYLHRGISCEECGERPIRGVRWHCLNCADFDLCAACEVNNNHHKTHVFAKITIPLPRIAQPTQQASSWYPGDPSQSHPALGDDFKKRLEKTYGFNGPELDAHYDQFCVTANTTRRGSRNTVTAVIDRQAFSKALTLDRWPERLRPNILYDRMFAFYDTDADGTIDFEEFVSGLAYLRGPQRFGSLRRALEGFDFDNDGFLSRKDFLRIFHAKFEVQNLILRDTIEAAQAAQTQMAMETVRSSQPISSIFNNDEIPVGEARVPEGKRLNAVGDMQPVRANSTVLEDNEGWPVLDGDNRRVPNHERLQHHLSRFEELLSSPSEATDRGAADTEERGHQTIESAAQVNGDGHDDSNDEDSVPRLIDSSDPALDQDVLWDVIGSGFYLMLDPLFLDKERRDAHIIDRVRKEMEKWKKEIDEIKEQDKARKEAPMSLGAEDPLMATAAEIANTSGASQSSPVTSTMQEAMVPTDTASLERHESEIASQSLGELLDMTGYGIVEQQAADSGSTGNLEVHDGASPDATMPQNRPDSTRSGVMSSDEGSAGTVTGEVTGETESPPPREHLEYLIRCEEEDREIRFRGGPGMMSFAEIEAVVQADQAMLLRGLITGWLELASF